MIRVFLISSDLVDVDVVFILCSQLLVRHSQYNGVIYVFWLVLLGVRAQNGARALMTLFS